MKYIKRFFEAYGPLRYRIAYAIGAVLYEDVYYKEFLVTCDLKCGGWAQVTKHGHIEKKVLPYISPKV